MNKLFSLLFLLFFSTTNAQIHELGIFVGGSNFIGDVGVTTYIAPNEPAFGILYKWNKSPRHSYRISYTQSTISGNDLDSEEPSRNQRGYSFENDIKELSLGLEFNFFDFNLHEIKTKVTPYVHSGISYFMCDELYLAPEETIKNSKTRSSLAIPITLGVKSNISPNFVLGLEVGARYTFTDNLDGSNPDGHYKEFGNINNNDWYVFSGLTLTYTFGNKPCYCAE
ncbi:MAG TPA: DUF6089 family protein [Flavobacterium sp.]